MCISPDSRSYARLQTTEAWMRIWGRITIAPEGALYRETACRYVTGQMRYTAV